MDTLQAFAIGMANKDKELRVFDWHEAARLIAKRRPVHASAGLSGDWEWTGGTIYAHGKPAEENDGCFLASTWATPELDMDGEVFGCWTMQSKTPNWDADTFWPKSALDILNAKEAN